MQTATNFSIAEMDDRMRRLLKETGRLGIVLSLRDDGGVHAYSADRKLTPTLCNEIRALTIELAEHLAAQGETIIDDAQERAHADRNTLPAPALSRDDKLRASLKASKRMYMNGEVLVNHPNNMGAYMRRLREQDERRQAAERGELPPQGRYKTNFDVFNRKEYEG